MTKHLSTPASVASFARVDAATRRWRAAFLEALDDPLVVVELFDRMPNVVFSVKDRTGRYISISATCAERCGLSSKSEAIGRTAYDIFPRHMADRYVRQDELLFRTGRPIRDNLDLTLFRDRSPGWCLTDKLPLHDRSGSVVGLACLSQDLLEPRGAGLVDESFAAAIDHVLAHYDQPLRVPQLARLAGVSTAQLERRMKRVFGISVIQFLIKTRIEAAARALTGSEQPVSEIAMATGFCDQSALSRQFKQVTGLTPREFRQHTRTEG
jgi:AraC-like DNA-binding protein